MKTNLIIFAVLLITITLSCQQQHATHRETQKELEEKNKAVCRRYYEVVNTKNLDVFDEIFSPDYFEPQNPNWTHEWHKQYFKNNFTAFPDIRTTIINMIAEGDMVAIVYEVTATHLGVFNDVPPTGNKIKMQGMHFFRVVDGKIVQGYYNYDHYGLLLQMGYKMIPPKKQ